MPNGSNGQPHRASEFLFASLWCGIFFGLAEAVVLLCLYNFTKINMWRNGVGPQILWVGPLVNAALFLLVGIALALLHRLLKSEWKQWVWPLGVALLAGLVVFGLAMTPRAIKIYGISIATLGALVQGYRWARKNEHPAFFRRTLPALCVLAVLAGIGGETWVRWSESSYLASLPTAAKGQPNVLIIIIDALRADHLSAYGYARPTTPNLEEFAAEGILFEKAFSTSHWTLPGHKGILSDIYHFGSADLTLRGESPPPQISEVLARRGYATMASSSNNMWFTPKSGFARGFARFDVYFHNWGDRISRTFYGKMLANAYRTYGGHFDQVGRRRADEVNRQLFEWIDRTAPSGRPFFAALNYMEVHDPYWPPPPFTTRFSDKVTRHNLLAAIGYDSHPSRKLNAEEVQLLLDAYDSCLVYADAMMGQLFDELRRRGMMDNTVIILTGDHGEAIGEEGKYGHTVPIMRQEVTRVPLIVRFPVRLPAGVRVPHPVSIRQIPATILDLLGTDVNSPYEGPSLLNSVLDRDEAVLSTEGGVHGLALGDWHFVVQRDVQKKQLFNLKNDPQETADLAGRPETAEIQRNLQQRLDAIITVLADAAARRAKKTK